MEHRSTPPVQEMINAEALPPSLSAPTSAAAQVHGETTASLERDYAENKTHVSSQELVSFDEDTGDEGQRKAEADHGDTEEQANGHASAFDEAPPAPRSQFAFVSYREEVRGLSDLPGDPSRRLKHWLLMDSEGHEHVAVDTTDWHGTKKRYTYAAVPPFSEVKKLQCYNQRAVLEYLDLFVPPHARMADSLVHFPQCDAPSGIPSPKSTKRISGMDKGKKKRMPVVEVPNQEKKKTVKKAASLPSSKAEPIPSARESPFICDSTLRNMARSRRMAAVMQELEALQAECDVHFSLTLIDPDRRMEVWNSTPAAAAAIHGDDNNNINRSTLAVNQHLESLKAPAERNRPHPPTTVTAQPAVVKSNELSTIKKNVPSKKKRKTGVPGDEEEEDGRKRTKQPPSPTDPDVAKVISAMEDSDKIYMPGRWKHDVLPGHDILQVLDDFHLSEECGEALDKEVLPQKLSVRLPITDFAGGPGAPAPPGPDEILKVVNSLPKPVSDSHVQMKAVWGIDSYTRTVFDIALSSCSALPDEPARNAFVVKDIIPAMNSLAEEGWDVMKALKTIALKRGTDAKGTHDGGAGKAVEVVAAAARHLLRVLRGLEQHSHGSGMCPPKQREWCRGHSKGEGVVVKHKQGIPAGTFLGEYLGELCAAWRWAEREMRGCGNIGNKSKNNTARMGASPDFFNVALERPKGDPRGYDVFYVDAAKKSNFVSRLGHSCDPNCRNITVVAGGRLTLGVWTTRDVAADEELTIDFGAETESSREAQNSVCLCSSAICRGTFVDLAADPSSPLSSYFLEHCTLLDRIKKLVDVSTVPELSDEDQDRLRRRGFKECILYDGVPPGALHVPQWLHKWVAMVLADIDAEEEALKKKMIWGEDAEIVRDGASVEEADEEITQHMSSRIHALAVTMDRAKLFLRHQPEELRKFSPLRLLTDAEVAEYLWKGPESIARRVLGAILSLMQHSLSTRGIASVGKRYGRRSSDQRLGTWRKLPKGRDHGVIKEEGAHAHPGKDSIDEGVAKSAGDGDEVSMTMEALEAVVHSVQEFIKATEVESAKQAREALRALAALLRAAGKGHAAMHDVVLLYASTQVFMEQTEYTAFSSQLCNGAEGMRYRSPFLWGLTCQWHRSSGDPIDLLSLERRGCVSLPDLENLYLPVYTSGQYLKAGGDRGFLLKHLKESPRAPWPKTIGNFTFRNVHRIFGSPQLDETLQGSVCPRAGVSGLVGELESAEFV